MTEPLAVQPIMQVGASSCAVAALAMYLNRPYRDVSEVAMALWPNVHACGLWSTQMRKVAAKLGCPLVVQRAPVRDISEQTGILCVSRKRLAHAALLFQGVVIDPQDGQVWDLETWVATRCWRVTALLVAG